MSEQEDKIKQLIERGKLNPAAHGDMVPPEDILNRMKYAKTMGALVEPGEVIYKAKSDMERPQFIGKKEPEHKYMKTREAYAKNLERVMQNHRQLMALGIPEDTLRPYMQQKMEQAAEIQNVTRQDNPNQYQMAEMPLFDEPVLQKQFINRPATVRDEWDLQQKIKEQELEQEKELRMQRMMHDDLFLGLEQGAENNA